MLGGKVEMKNLKIKNLDELYSCLKSEAGQLRNVSWGSPAYEVSFEENTLLGWFFKNIHALKSGCYKILVARASVIDPSYSYTRNSERLYVSSDYLPNTGIVVRVTRTRFERSGSDSYDGTYSCRLADPAEQVFVLETEPAEELV